MPQSSEPDATAMHDDVAVLSRRVEQVQRQFDHLVRAVIPIGVALLEEKNFSRMVETILETAKALCNADGGTLYLRTDDERLEFTIVRNDSLHLSWGGTSGTPVAFPPVQLYDADGAPNHHNIASHAALTAGSVNIADAYAAHGFDFSGTRAFDARSGYRSTSFLAVPLKNQSDRVIGVLQLLNAKDPATGAIIPFDAAVQPVIESLSQLAAAALEAYLREERLRREIAELHIRIDESKKARQVTEITDTDYFRELQRKARELRNRL